MGQSRRAVLETTFHVDAQHPTRRLVFEIGMLMLPGFVGVLVVGIFFIMAV